MLVGNIHVTISKAYLVARAGSCEKNTRDLTREGASITRVTKVRQGLDCRNRHLLLAEPRLDVGHEKSVLEKLRHCDLLDLPENLLKQQKCISEKFDRTSG